MESYHIIIIVIAVSGSAVIKNSVGIGAGVFLLPVLTLVLPPKIALGLGAPAMLISDSARPATPVHCFVSRSLLVRRTEIQISAEAVSAA